ncbi:MAG: WD40 repeat domain-containing protein [Methylobacteriaceae bacterium]|nr:WD40 repeat domain-containing protein [Methylobacteriaceae bacterium]
MGEPSLTESTTLIDAGAEVVAAAFLGRTPALALADGNVLFPGPGEERRIAAHPGGAVLVTASDGKRLVTGGDDGRLVATDAGGRAQEIVDENGKWIDALTLARDGAIGWSVGRTVRVRDNKGAVQSFDAPSSVRGLAFMRKGYRLAIAHYNGVSLWFPNASAAPEKLEWKGSHIDVTVSPDGRFVLTTMQENTLHGWRLADGKHMRMSGYPGKTRSLSWSSDGHWLATSGAQACIVWPFATREGPMGRSPRECGVRNAKVSRVAFHPQIAILAIGYEDGWVLLARLTDDAEVLVRGPRAGEDTSAITALAWEAKGKRLLFGTASGAAGLLHLP